MKTQFIAASILISQLHLLAGDLDHTGEGYVAHEWGTFTSVQGADGNLIEWNPLITTQLPSFVYARQQPAIGGRTSLVGVKDAFLALQRLETPVVYFYSDRERTVDVTVRFPEGMITEWYPCAAGASRSWVQANPALSDSNDAARGSSAQSYPHFVALDPKTNVRQGGIRWPGLRILPANQSLKAEGLLRSDSSGNHYYAARATDANLVQVTSCLNESDKVEQEKFLFYRGLGSFGTPLKLTLSGANEEQMTLQNDGPEDLAHLFVLNVEGDRGAFVYKARWPAGHEETLRLKFSRNSQPLSSLVENISATMRQALEAEGLYPREAAAMVQTWRDSWFQEPGWRVLYVLPRGWTDRILPMTIAPAPRELTRVMVGRAEIITPHREWELLKQIVHFGSPDPKEKRQAIEDFRALGLGRFAEPAVRRVLGNKPSVELSQTAWNLLDSARPAAGGLPGVAKN